MLSLVSSDLSLSEISLLLQLVVLVTTHLQLRPAFSVRTHAFTGL